MSDEGGKALAHLLTFEAKNVFYYQNECKAFRILKDFDKSLHSIETALACKDIIKDYQLSALLHDKAVTMKALGDENCIGILEQAIKLANYKENYR